MDTTFIASSASTPSADWIPTRTLAFKIALLYFLLGGLWISLSGYVVYHGVANPALRAAIENAKGWLFVLVTTLFLGSALQRYFNRIRYSAELLRARETQRELLLALESSARAEAEKARHQVDRILESVSDAFFALDHDWHFTYVNRRAAAMFNRQPEQLLGRCLWAEFPEGLGAPFRLAYEQAMTQQHARQLEDYSPLCNRWLENRIYPSADGLAVVSQDVTERKQREALLESQRQVLELIAKGAPLAETLETLLRAAEAQSTGFLWAVLGLEQDSLQLRHLAAPSLPKAFLASLEPLPVSEGAGSCATAASRGKPVLVEDILTDPLWVNYRPVAAREGLRSCWSTPIFDGQQHLLGTLAIYSRRPSLPSPEQVQLMDLVAHVAAIAIGRERAESARQETEEALHQLSAYLVRVQDQERRRISRELHDTTAQHLAALTLTLSNLKRLISGPPSEAQTLCIDSLQLATQAAQEIRTQSYLLHPPLLEAIGLQGAVEDYAKGFSARSGIKVEVHAPKELGRLSEEVELTLFRIVQESLANVLRHSGSPQAKIRFTRQATSVTLDIQDMGKGIPADKLARITAMQGDFGVGLGGMRERLRLLHGSLEIASGPMGTRVCAVVPVPPPAAERPDSGESTCGLRGAGN